MSTTVRRSIRRSAIAALGAALLATMIGYPEARGADRNPSLRLLRSESEVLIERFGEEPVPLDLGTYVASKWGAFELRVKKVGGSYEVQQVVPTSTGVRTIRRLSGNLIHEEFGLKDFFEVTARRAGSTRVAASSKASFCPGGWNQARVDDSGPDLTTYPLWAGCWFGQVTKALVWGIDKGWATGAPEAWGDGSLDLGDGLYDITLRISRPYRDLFGIAAADATATVRARVATLEWEEGDWWPPEDPRRFDQRRPSAGGGGAGIASTGRGRGRGDHPHAHDPNRSPQVQDDASGLPDLIALPAWGATVEEIDGDEYMTFAANVWNKGPGPLVVEGFRSQGQPLMDAYQYFYKGGEKTGRKLVGTLEYDDRDHHRHWHFTDFARYRLLNADGTKVVQSTKEAFCLAPTDAVDLTVPGANYRPSWTGLSTSCGGERSIWIREILDVGWGDTYWQWAPGQSFPLTGVRNGTYLIEVVTNPDGRLSEASRSNNRSVARVTIGGRPGARTVRMG